MAFKIAIIIVLVVGVAAEVHHPLFYQDSLAYVATEEKDQDVQDPYRLIGLDTSLDHPPFSLEGRESPWNYIVPIANFEPLVHTTYSAPAQALPLAAPWTHDVPLAYSNSVTPTTAANPIEEIPFGYVPSVAKISVPPGYKIH